MPRKDTRLNPAAYDTLSRLRAEGVGDTPATPVPASVKRLMLRKWAGICRVNGCERPSHRGGHCRWHWMERYARDAVRHKKFRFPKDRDADGRLVPMSLGDLPPPDGRHRRVVAQMQCPQCEEEVALVAIEPLIRQVVEAFYERHYGPGKACAPYIQRVTYYPVRKAGPTPAWFLKLKAGAPCSN